MSYRPRRSLKLGAAAPRRAAPTAGYLLGDVADPARRRMRLWTAAVDGSTPPFLGYLLQGVSQ